MTQGEAQLASMSTALEQQRSRLSVSKKAEKQRLAKMEEDLERMREEDVKREEMRAEMRSEIKRVVKGKAKKKERALKEEVEKYKRKYKAANNLLKKQAGVASDLEGENATLKAQVSRLEEQVERLKKGKAQRAGITNGRPAKESKANSKKRVLDESR